EADPEPPPPPPAREPADRSLEPRGEERDVEDLAAIPCFHLGQQVERQGPQPIVLQALGDLHVPRRTPAPRPPAAPSCSAGGVGKREGRPAVRAGPPGAPRLLRRRPIAATAEIRFESRSLRSASRSISRTRSPERPSTLPVSRSDSACPFSSP